MRKPLLWMFVSLLTLPAAGNRSAVMPLPIAPPLRYAAHPDIGRVIRLEVEYDETLVAQHGEALEAVIREAIAIHNVEWRRYRSEWFELARLTFRPSGAERDASYVLANFLHRTAEQRDTIHVNIVGRPLEVYTSGRQALPIGGLAYRGSDAVVISATPGVTTELLAYYLFHELGHCWDAYDIPFRGGDTTFGSKTRMTFDIDAGNEEIIEDSPGPLPRGTPRRAPMIIRGKLAGARAVARDMAAYPALHDLLLHEPSPANPAYVAKKQALLAAAGRDRQKISRLLKQYEITPQHLRDDAEVRQQIADHYWRANDAIRKRDYDTADLELQAIRSIAGSAPDVHLLVGAVEKKARKRR